MAKKRVSKVEWLQTALDLLEREGIEAIRVERLARELGISKSGFYWHFKDREDLRNEIIDFWAHEFTEVLSRNPRMREGEPRELLRRTMEIILEHHLGRYDLPMQAWAAADPGIAKRVRQVYRMRMEFVGSLFERLGFKGAELEMRTRLFVCYQSWERVTFPSSSKKSLAKFIERRLDLLTRR